MMDYIIDDAVLDAAIREVGGIGLTKMQDLVALLECSGKDFVRLDIGYPGVDLSDDMRGVELEALTASHYRNDTMRYAGWLGLESLREEVCHLYTSQLSLDVHPSDVLITAGVTEATNTILQLLAAEQRQSDDPQRNGVQLLTPYFTLTAAQIVSSGLQLQRVDSIQREGLVYRVADVADRSCALVYSNPSNPHGMVLSDEEITGLVGVGLPIISDDAYLTTVHNGSLSHALSYTQNACSAGSMSKTYSRAGMRIGWLVMGKELRDRFPAVAGQRIVQTVHPNNTAQYVAMKLLQRDREQGYVEADRIAVAYKQNLDLLVPLLNDAGFVALSGGPVQVSDGSIYVVARHPRYSSGDHTSRALLRYGITTVPLECFGTDQVGIRLSVSTFTGSCLGKLASRLQAFSKES